MPDRRSEASRDFRAGVTWSGLRPPADVLQSTGDLDDFRPLLTNAVPHMSRTTLRPPSIAVGIIALTYFTSSPVVF